MILAMDSLFDIFGDRRVDIIVLSFGSSLAAGITGVVMILSGSARFQFAAASHFYFLGNRLLGFHLGHIWTNL